MNFSFLGFLKELKERNSFLFNMGLFFLILFIWNLLMTVIDNRLVGGYNAWLKPSRFAVSFAIFLISMGWYLIYLPISYRLIKLFSFLLGVVVFLEYNLIVFQAGRGISSHFNSFTFLDTFIFQMITILNVVIGFLVLIVFLCFMGKGVKLPMTYLWGIRLGLLVFLVSCALGGLMIKLNSHSIGLESLGGGIPFLNWNENGGDLRVSHLVGIHGLQIIPFFSWILHQMKESWRIHFPLIWLLSITLIYFLFILYLLFEALAGYSFLKL
ncbi:hypothetical protein [Xanthovirga aplysinae]|uniref:hypothetical protein n=1 Tax=Xanthovirga aplysinae TaxID=2529853 RepID=UPI0012BBA781|nr:hypothetical protein [Xanthovirga aplysinae]MTI31518.1 hypothetical protein [Xanthovirga aplysinae]